MRGRKIMLMKLLSRQLKNGDEFIPMRVNKAKSRKLKNTIAKTAKVDLQSLRLNLKTY